MANKALLTVRTEKRQGEEHDHMTTLNERPPALKLPPDLSPELWAAHGPLIQALATRLGLTELHHIGLVVEQKHPHAEFVPSTSCWVGPVERGVETLHFESEEQRRTYSRPHFCFAVGKIEPYLQQGYPLVGRVCGPLGPAAFITVNGETVELLEPVG